MFLASISCIERSSSVDGHFTQLFFHPGRDRSEAFADLAKQNSNFSFLAAFLTTLPYSWTDNLMVL